jgi:ribonuclease D
MKKQYTDLVNAEYFENDISKVYFNRAINNKVVAWDIETSGLDWSKDRIGLCQLYTPTKNLAIVKIGNTPPKNLQKLLFESSVKKIFHYAIFDLRFMRYHWNAVSKNVSCTKIASKLLQIQNKKNHSLQSILKYHLNIEINKNERLSNWLSNSLTEEQISYAANDVKYLIPLLQTLEKQLENKGLLNLAHASFAHIPTRVELDLKHYGDIYNYQ